MPNGPITNSTASDNLPLQMAVATLARFIINTSRRFLYPFAPALSRGLGVPLPAITSLIALNQATGLLSPFFGPLSDRWGYRTMMLLGLGFLGAGMALAGLFPIYVMLAVGIFLGGLAKSLYDPALQAYIGERVTYQRRGMVIGLVEMSWAGASLIGIPLVGLLIDGWGWRAPFLVLSGLAIVSILVMAVVIPARRDGDFAAAPTITGFKQAWRTMTSSRAALGALIYGFFVAMANDSIFVVYGAWLETAFGLGLVALGSATSVIGIAELSGETLVATLSDRIGPKRAVLGGAMLTAVSYALLPLIGQTLPLALAGLFIAFISFEFTIVTGFSLITEVLPAARGTMTASFLAVSSFGRMLGALWGGPLWLFGGMLGVSMAASVITVVGLLSLIWGLRTSTLR